jgi:linoleoyl-CoA desaturase
MDTLKFKSDDANELKFAKELKKKVNNYFRENNLSKKGGYRMPLKLLVMLSLYFTPFVILLSLNFQPEQALLLVVVMGIGEAGIGMSVMHDGTHGTYSEKK